MKGRGAAVIPGVLVLSLMSATAGARDETGSEGAFEALFGVTFRDENTGWAVGRNSLILHTRDGGVSWRVQHRSRGGEERVLRSVSFANDTHGVAVGTGGIILRTEDGGRRWLPSSGIRLPRWQRLKAEIRQRELSGFVVGAEARAYCTSQVDGTPDAETLALPSDEEDASTPRDIAAVEEERAQRAEAFEACLASLEAEFSAETESKRREFEHLSEFAPRARMSKVNFVDVQFADQTTGFMLSEWELFRSVDFGRSWNVLPHPEEMRPFDLFFYDTWTGWLVGDGGKVFRTDDRGDSWDDISVPLPWRLTAVFFLDEDRGWVGGEAGVMMATTDGGETWKRIETGLKESITGLHWATPEQGIVVTTERAFRTDNGGATWSEIRLPEEAPEWRFASKDNIPGPLAGTFADARTGYLVGTFGLVMATRDGGRSWQHLRSDMKHRADLIKARRSIDHAKIGYNVDLGYVHPVGRIGDRFGPGLYLGMDFMGGRGRVKLGGGFNMNLMADRETITVPAGVIDESEPTDLGKTGVLFNVPFIAQVSLFEKGPWLLRGVAGVGFIFHGWKLSDAHASLVGDADYGRSRIGVGLTQALVFGWMYGSSRTLDPERITRGGVHLRVGLQETWTWDVDDVQTDLGRRDDRRFGTELWPIVALGLSLYN